MSLRLIHGPPNSGRAGLVREGLLASLAHEPVLVVPNLDDVYAFEREICAAGAVLGGSVLTFDGLFRQVAGAAGIRVAEPLSESQQLRIASAACRRAALGPLKRAARRPGFPAALRELIAELGAAGIGPAELQGIASTLEGSAYLEDLAALYRDFIALCSQAGRREPGELARTAIAGLRGDPDSWRARPVFLYDFDDLTAAQFELIAALSEATEVTVALTYESRAALAARAALLSRLRELGTSGEVQMHAEPDNTPSALLFHLERNFLVDSAPRAAPDEGLTLLRSAGVRSEAELIGAEAARLLSEGALPDQIAVAVRDPGGRGPLLARVLEGFGIPVALEAELQISSTATGGCVLALLHAAFGSQSAEDLLSYLRGPRRAPPARIDWLERSVRREGISDATRAAEEWARLDGERPRELVRILAASEDPRALLHRIAELARDVAQWPLARAEQKGRSVGEAASRELRAGEVIAGAMEELAQLEGLEPSPAELAATLEGLTMPLWSGPPEGRLRIASPYRLRASRFEHLFVASLQDGEFPQHERIGPFLSDEQRGLLGLPERANTQNEESYLFYACLSLPRRRLFLSCRTSDEDGGAEQPSPFIDEVRALLEPQDRLEAEHLRVRPLGELVFSPAEAPSERELARSLAVYPEPPSEVLGALGIGKERTARIERELAGARALDLSSQSPGPLTLAPVREALSSTDLFGGTTLETFEVCSYRWFIDHELCPEPLEPRPEALTQGGLMHLALERLYRERPCESALPRPASLDRWIERGRQIVGELCEERLGERPADRAVRRRLEALLEAFLRRESAKPSSDLEPALLEASFDDDGTDAARPALRVDDWRLHGQIDRVDVGERWGLVHDYKLARAVTPVAKFRKAGKLQLPLYLMALRELWGIEPGGALYQPLRAGKDPRPRGLVRSDLAAREGLELVGRDLLDPEAFEAELEGARQRASDDVARIRAGDIDRDPIEGRCPAYCGFAPICRRERAPAGEAPEEPEESA